MLEQWSQSIREIPVTWGLFAVQFILYLYISSIDPSFSTETLQRFGGQHNPLVWKGEIYRLLVSGFLHGGTLHFLLNNLALVSLGRLLERLFGSAQFLGLYILALIGGNLVSLIWMPPMVVSVGASGAIMGLAGALFGFLLLDRKGRFLVATPSGRHLFFALVLLQFLIGETFSFINNAAHFGGFIVGVFFGIYFWSRIPGTGVPRAVGSFLMVVCFAGLAGLAYWGLQPKGTYAWHLHQGLMAFQDKDNKHAQKNAQKAYHHLTIAQKRKPSEEISLYLSELLIQRKEYRKAAPHLEKLVKTHPERFLFWFRWIDALARSGQMKRAQEAFQKARDRFVQGKVKLSFWQQLSQLLAPEPPSRELSLARLYTAVQQERNAILLYIQLLEQTPSDPVINNDYAWLLTTAVQRHFRNPKLAIEHARLAVQSSPNAAFLDTLANAYFANRQIKKAIETETRALYAQGAEWTMPHLHMQLEKFRKALPPEPKRSTPQRTAPQRTTPTKSSLPLKRAALSPKSATTGRIAPPPRRGPNTTSQPPQKRGQRYHKLEAPRRSKVEPKRIP